VAALLRQEPSSLVVAGAHLTAGRDGSPLTPALGEEAIADA
jgi:hypothetical protein